MERLKVEPEDGEAWTAFELHFTPVAEGIVRGILRTSPQLWEDAVQGFFMKVARKRPFLRMPVSEFIMYAKRMCKNHARTDHRGERRRRDDVDLDGLASEPSSPTSANEEDRILARLTIAEFFERLDAEDRLILVRSAVEGMSAQEISEETGLSADTIYQRVSRMKKKLRKFWDG